MGRTKQTARKSTGARTQRKKLTNKVSRCPPDTADTALPQPSTTTTAGELITDEAAPLVQAASQDTEMDTKMDEQKDEEQKECSSSSMTDEAKEQPSGVTDSTAEAEAKSDDTSGHRGRKRKRDKVAAKVAKSKKPESLADVSNFPVDVSGVSFMLMGDVNRSLCEGLIYQHGAVVSKQVQKRQQYVIAGPPKRTYWWGGSTGEHTLIWKEAQQTGKTFISQYDFEQWMERVQAAKDEAEREAHAADDHLVQLLMEATPLPEVLVQVVVEYALDEAPLLPIVRRWLKLEQRASDGAHSNTLPPPATDEQIADVESKLMTRLPLALRQLLRMHNGASLQGDAAGMCVFPSTNDLLAPRSHWELFTVPLRWLMWHRDLDADRTPHRVQSVYFVPPNGPVVAMIHDAAWESQYVLTQSAEQFMSEYVDMWKERIDAGEQEQQGQEGMQHGTTGEEKEERKESEVTSATTDDEQPENKDETVGVHSATSSTAALSAASLSPQARFVAACRPSALSVPCMLHTLPSLRSSYPRLWRQVQTTQQRGHRQHQMWENRLVSHA